MGLSEAMKQKMPASFENFPPKAVKGTESLPGTLKHLSRFGPDCKGR